MDRDTLEAVITDDKRVIALASFVVAIGLVGEYWKEIVKVWSIYWDTYPISFRLVPQMIRAARLLLFFPILVVFGVLLEWKYEADVSVRESEYTQLLDTQNTALAQKAEKATERAEKSEAARVAMLEQLKPRDLTKAQVDTIAAGLRGHFKQIFLASRADSDAMSFMFAIAEAIRRSGAEPKLILDKSGVPGKLWTEWDVPAALAGITIYAAKDDQEILLNAFVKAGVTGGLGGATAPNAQFKDVPAPTILVGVKPEPFEQFPAYATPPSLEQWQKEHPPPWDPK